MRRATPLSLGAAACLVVAAGVGIAGAGAASASPLPDLVVTAASATPAVPAVGQAVTFKATVKNVGTAATPASTLLGVGFLVDGTSVTWSDTDRTPLAVGASVTLTADNSSVAGNGTWIATSGTHTVTAFVDDANRIPESNENDNKLSFGLTPKANLVADNGFENASSAPWDLGEFAPPAIVETSAQLGTPCVQGRDCLYFDGGEYDCTATQALTTVPNHVYELDFQALPIGAIEGDPGGGPTDYTAVMGVTAGSVAQTISADTTPPYTARWARHTLTFTATSTSTSIGFDSYAHHFGEQTWALDDVAVTDVSKPNLTVTSVTASPAHPTHGNAVTFSAVVRNAGVVSTPAGVELGVIFSVDGTPVSYSTSDSAALAPGASVTLRANTGPTGHATWTATAGSHTVKATADPAGRIAESNESDNVRSVTLAVS